MTNQGSFIRRFILICIVMDDYSYRVWMYIMHHKYEVLDVFLNWKKMIKTQTNKKIKWLRSDNNDKYKSDRS